MVDAMSEPQPGILESCPTACRYLFLRPRPDVDVRPSLRLLAQRPIDDSWVVGIGSPVAAAVGLEIEGLRVHPALTGSGVVVPSTQAGLWLWLRGEDRGTLLHTGRELTELLAPGFALDEVIEGFRHREGRDLSGYEDGTENPVGDAAIAAALTSDGGSFVAVQRWVHDLQRLWTMTPSERDANVGRRVSDNEEIDDAPASAHVKRTAQESFSPPAFVLRRSMAWTDPEREGLVFVAFGRSFDAYESLLRRMLGLEDSITDALFRFTRPISGSYFYCPPCARGRVQLDV
jgi:putative iron-dependent peroxidase